MSARSPNRRSDPIPVQGRNAEPQERLHLATSRLASPPLAPLVDELARRLAAGDDPATLTIRDAPMPTRQAIADLFGLARLPAARCQVRVDRLAGALGLESAADVTRIVDALRGPLPDRRAERQRAQAGRRTLWEWLRREAVATPLFDDARVAEAWVEAQQAKGARGGVEAHRARLRRALAVLRALPVDGLPLAVLAETHAGGPHALDRGRSLAAMVLEAIALATGAPPARDAETARALWEAMGVVPDQLSSTVLVLGLHGADSTPLGRWLTSAASAGEPVVLTLASLRRWPRPPLPPHEYLYVFENPSVVAEAARAGWDGPPLVCSSGRPTVAVVTLLRQLGGEGATLNQHADFDAAGIAITAWLAERAGTTPWRMTAAAYLAAATNSAAEPEARDAIGVTPWDPSLAPAIDARGVRVYEESLVGDLLRGAAIRPVGERQQAEEGLR